MSTITQTNPTSISLANIIYINPASTYAFLILLLPPKMSFIIYPAYAVVIQWLHQSSFYLHDKIASSL